MKMKEKYTEVRRALLTLSDMRVRETGQGRKPGRTITGYAILFNNLSEPLYSDDDEECREMILPGAVTKELLDGSDIKMTMFHDPELLLARSRNGEGTLKYRVDKKGVAFEFEAPETDDGDKALELVRRGDICGCSFMFSTHYYDEDYVERSVRRVNGRNLITYRVKVITGIYDFTLAADPAYLDTSTEASERQLNKDLISGIKEIELSRQVQEMRSAADFSL